MRGHQIRCGEFQRRHRPIQKDRPPGGKDSNRTIVTRDTADRHHFGQLRQKLIALVKKPCRHVARCGAGHDGTIDPLKLFQGGIDLLDHLRNLAVRPATRGLNRI